MLIDAKIDLTGMKLGRWTVLSQAPNKLRYGKMWNCKCDCGTKKIVAGKYLRNGQSQSCGCLQKEIVGKNSKQKVIDLKNKKFGKLTVINRNNSTLDGKATWLCQCDCGNIISVRGCDLRNGHTTSCGCIKFSLGEAKITKLLSQHQISFETQKTFETCKKDRLLKFDFYVEGTYIIEFDGRQHFEISGGWNDEEHFKKTQEYDNFKNNWCKENNIPLIRIPYMHLKDLCIEDLLLETSDFILRQGGDDL